MAEDFEFLVRAPVPEHQSAPLQRERGAFREARVVVRGLTVTVFDAITRARLCAGIWDRGGYVRYADSHLLIVHPLLLDAVDGELRERMSEPGELTRAPELRRSAVGYSDY